MAGIVSLRRVSKMRLLLFLVCAVCATTQKITYKNYKTYQVSPSNKEHLHILQTFENNKNVDFWTELTKMIRPLLVMVGPQFQPEFENVLTQHKILYKITIENVETMLKKEMQSPLRLPSHKVNKITFDRYYRYAEINGYLNNLAIERPKLVVKESYGSSYENRTLNLIRISTGGNEQKPIIFVDGGIHAREWIGPAQVLFIIHSLLERPENHHMFENIDWVIIPLLNPDGYEYTHTTDRFWRKTRSRGKICDGVDPNRNFGYHWMGDGSSDDECSNTYGGPSAFSEPETLALSKVIKKFANRTKLYLTYHSPAECFLYPWGYKEELPPNVDELHGLAAKCAKAIEDVNGRNYTIGNSYNLLNPAAGSSRDYAYGEAGIKLAYTMELPSGGEHIYDIPPEDIFGVVSEMFEAVKVFHKYIEKNYRN